MLLVIRVPTCIISKYKSKLLQIGSVYTIPKALKRYYYQEFVCKAHNLRLINSNIWF